MFANLAFMICRHMWTDWNRRNDYAYGSAFVCNNRFL